jgi:hypothetical protein
LLVANGIPCVGIISFVVVCESGEWMNGLGKWNELGKWVTEMVNGVNWVGE